MTERRPLLLAIAEAGLVFEREFRARHPERFQDRDFLTVEGVARLLYCSVDQIRRIPRQELPAYDGPGKRLLYFREDVLRYMRSRPAGTRQVGMALRDRAETANDEIATGFNPREAARRLRMKERGQ